MILVHICCGPCVIAIADYFFEKGIEFKGYFYNPNIHPYKEFRRRIRALEEVAEVKGFEVVWDKTYGLREFLKETFLWWDKPGKRCERCYYMRLASTAKKAKELGADGFTTTMLYSPFQNHELLKSLGEFFAEKYEIKFFYHDFREFYEDGKRQAKEMGIYTQGYCGCVFSEEERYYKKRRKELLRAGIRV